MPECKRCRGVFLAGETHDCRDFRNGHLKTVDALIVWFAGGGIVSLGLGLTGAASPALSIPGAIIFGALLVWRQLVVRRSR